jgi:lysyl-tRNA synthetase class 2
MAYADYQQVMEFTEQMILFVADNVLGKRTITYQGHEINLIPHGRCPGSSDGSARH